jgi:hypothetical protein
MVLTLLWPLKKGDLARHKKAASPWWKEAAFMP